MGLARRRLGIIVLVACLGCGTRTNDIVVATDDSTKALLQASGASALMEQRGVPEGTNLIVGALDFEFDDLSKGFRLALMIRTEDDQRITDFFKGIPAGDSPIVGRGNARRPIPRVTSSTIEFATTSHQDANSESHPSLSTVCARYIRESGLLHFAKDFPEYVDKDFGLTFKEFKGSAYYLKDVPSGIAYVWLQTPFDGNRVTHYPIALDLKPETQAVNRLDIRIESFAQVFGDL